MENKDKIDSLKFLSETHRREFNERRRYEIKILLTVLTFYVLAGSTRFTEHFPDDLPCWFKAIIWVSFTLLVIVSSVFLWFIHNANNANKTIAERSEKNIEGLIKGREVEIDLFSRPFIAEGPTRFANLVWEVASLALLAVSSAIILTSI